MAVTFLQNQTDFFCFAGGFALFAVAVFSLYARFSRQAEHRWLWLAAGALAGGGAEWLQMPAVRPTGLAASAVFVLLLVCYVGALLFARSQAVSRRRKAPRWLFFLLLVTPAAAMVTVPSLAEPLTGLFVGAPALLLAGLVLKHVHVTSRAADEPPPGWAVAFGFRCLAVLTGLRGACGLLSAVLAHPRALESVRLAEQAAAPAFTAAALFTAAGLWLLVRRLPRRAVETARTPRHRFGTRGRFWLGALAAVMLCGWFFTDRMGRKMEVRKEKFLLEQGATAAAMVDPAAAALLTRTASDVKSGAYLHLKKRLGEARRLAPDIRFVSLLGPQAAPTPGGTAEHLVVLADSEPETAPQRLLPGERFDEAREDAFRAIASGQALVKPAHVDRRGRWVTVFAPVPAAEGGAVPACLALSADAGQWRRELQAYRLIGVFFTGGVCLLLLGAFLILQDYRESAVLLSYGERKFEAVFESINDAIAIHDLATGDILLSNRKAYEMLGLDPAETPHPVTPFSAHEPPYDGEHADALIRRAAAGEPQSFEWVARDRNGRRFWVEVSLRKVTIGARDRLLAVVRNIDARKRAQEALLRSHEELEKNVRERTGELAKANAELQADVAARREVERELRESEARFRAVAENSHSGIMIFQDLKLMYANPGAERITGYTRAELMHADFWPFLHADHREALRDRCLARQRGEPAPAQSSVQMTHKNGKNLWIYANIGPVSYGGRTAVLMTFFDVTEQRRVEEERQAVEMRSLHVRKLESLGAMAGGIAHDFNNLLMAVIGNTDLILSGRTVDDETRRCLEEIRAASRRAATISEKMLAYSGRGSSVHETVDLGVFLHGMMPFLANFASTQVDVAFEIPASLPPVKADVDMIRQMIVNLVTNAAEAIGEKDGRILISAGVRACTRAELDGMSLGGSMIPGDFVFIQIADTGAGMDAETLERLFDPFFTTKFVGRGMGMPAVLGMMRNHGGCIGVDSAAGRGTRISLFLPCAGAAEQPAAADNRPAEPRRAAPPSAQPFILVVDDEEPLLRIVNTVLSKDGFRVRTASDGAQALEIFREAPDDVAAVILDLSMPGLSGERVLAEIHKLRPGAPVILTSGYSEQEATGGIRAGELAGFIKKPYRLDTLARKIRAVLGHSAPVSGGG